MNQAIFISSLFSVSIHSAEFVVDKLKLPRKNRKMERIEIYMGTSPIYTSIQIIFFIDDLTTVGIFSSITIPSTTFYSVELSFQLKRISILCFMAFHRCPTFFSHTQQQSTCSFGKTQFLQHITACSNIPVCSCLNIIMN